MVNIVASANKSKKMKRHKRKANVESFVYISNRKDLSYEKLNAIKPDYIFFPHWSYKIPQEVYENFECIIFHMTDVPFGRGGSPLQNLIARGIYETKISAIKCVEEFDAGPVYLKRPLSLYGTAEEILNRAYKVIEEMILHIVENKPIPVPQVGDITYFERRKPEDGDIGNLASINSVFDHIRMLDAEGYPPAFLEHGRLRLEFKRASLKGDHLLADVIITVRDENEE